MVPVLVLVHHLPQFGKLGAPPQGGDSIGVNSPHGTLLLARTALLIPHLMQTVPRSAFLIPLGLANRVDICLQRVEKIYYARHIE